MSEIHFIGGEKGGVGKSVVARLLAQYFIDHELAWRAFDADLSHGALMRYYSDYTQPLDIEQLEAMDGLIESSIEAPDHKLLVDLAAQSERKLHAWAEGVDLQEIASELGLQLVFWHVMDDGKDSLQLLERLLQRYGDSVRYVIVKNGLRGDRFDLFDQSDVQETIAARGIPVIELRALHRPIMQKIDRMDKSFWAAINNQGETDHALGLMERQRVKAWQKRAYQAFDTLGLKS
ncbi:mobilization protein [Acidihalobacter ferrooxydans]|uniref:Mobilization protein n=1 Tax=Acidihalobacter ferrooxydans TaxID=1765967 RepID=A0A1P8UDA4_9GAMM|nr:mobilization protein [Acidihalobacter ferrooxydans]APZ41764.1 mobilization protein [Acidihalobacter ferrooxydans]